MPRSQLQIAAVLAFSAGASLVVFLLTRSKEGKIQLPSHVNEENEYAEHDPFDVTKPEDVMDGYPIAEEKFWRRVRLLK